MAFIFNFNVLHQRLLSLSASSGSPRSKMRILLQVEALFFCYGNGFCLPPATPTHKFSTLDLFPFAHNVDKIG